MKQNILLLIAFLFIFTSCEETMVPIPDVKDFETDKTVLVEELTGVQCPNCPKGTAALEQILQTYGENVFAIGIHGELQADPLPDSKYDFRNEFARELEYFHAPYLGKPAATINRRQFDGEIFIPVDNIDIWLSLVELELEEPLQIAIALDHSFDESSRTINISADFVPVVDLDGEYKVSVFVTESEIIDLQENLGVIIEDYEHNHVLRHMMTKFDGDSLGDDLKEGDQLNKSFSYTVPDDFNTDHMEVVVSVHRNSTENKQILQSAGFKLK